MSDVLDRLRTSDPAADARGWSSSPTGESVRDRVVPVPRRRRSWVLAVAAAAVVLALAIGVAVVTTATDTSPAKPVSDIQRLVHGKWHRLPQSPISPVGRAQLFETSKGILLWAEYSDSGTPPGFHGALYNPVTKKWKKLAEPPVVLTQEGVWTGRDLIFPRASLAYDARTNRWRAIAAAPFLPDSNALATWTGSEVFVVTPPCATDGTECDPAAAWSAAVYKPAADGWTAVPPPSFGAVWEAIAGVGDGVTLWGQTAKANMVFQQGDSSNGWSSWAGLREPATGPGDLTAVGRETIWVGWSDGPSALTWATGLGRTGGRSLLTHPGICAVRLSSGPSRSAVVWCSVDEPLHLLDTAGNRWFELPSTHTTIQPDVLWTRQGLYAITTSGGLLVLR